jgi:hypothetical protein
VLTRMDYTARRVREWGGEELEHEFDRARPLVRAATIAYWLGTCYELFRPGRGKAFVLWGRPVVTVEAGPGSSTLQRVDVVARRAKVVRLPGTAAPGKHGIVVDGSVGAGVLHAGLGLWERLRTVLGTVTERGVGARSRATLAWAALVVRPDDVHELTLDPEADDVAEALLRCLDTRGIQERTAPLPIRAGSSVVGTPGA